MRRTGWRILALSQATGTRRAALALLLMAYAVLSLEPFDWRFPSSQANGAVRLAEGWEFPSAGIVIGEPPGLAGASAETLDVRLEVRPLSSEQSGPARILTISSDAYRRNLTLAQDGSDLVLRLRTEDTGRNGLHKGRPIARIEGVLEAGKWVAIDADIQPRRLTIAIDGVQRLDAPLPASVLESWDSGFGLALGNEMTCNRPWLGEIRKALIAGPGGIRDYALDGQAQAPAACQIIRHPPELVPFHPFYPSDALLNTLMYLPLGCLLGLMARRPSARGLGLRVLAIAGVSLAFETAQLFLVSRYPSIDDVIFNTLGGALGVWLGFWLAKRLRLFLPAR